MSFNIARAITRLSAAGVPQDAIERLLSSAADLPNIESMLESTRHSTPVKLIRGVHKLNPNSQRLIARVLRTIMQQMGITPPSKDIATQEGFEHACITDSNAGMLKQILNLASKTPELTQEFDAKTIASLVNFWESGVRSPESNSSEEEHLHEEQVEGGKLIFGRVAHGSATEQ